MFNYYSKEIPADFIQLNKNVINKSVSFGFLPILSKVLLELPEHKIVLVHHTYDFFRFCVKLKQSSDCPL